MNKNNIDWIKCKSGNMPDPGVDIIGINIETGDMEFGFRSEADTDNTLWLDFHFELTHWAYANMPE